MAIDLETRKYLEDLLDRKFDKKFDQKFAEQMVEIKRHNDTLLELFRHDLKAMTEQVPTRADVRGIVREELDVRIKPIESDIHVIKCEIKDINRKIDNHDKRITKLELKTA